MTTAMTCSGDDRARHINLTCTRNSLHACPLLREWLWESPPNEGVLLRQVREASCAREWKQHVHVKTPKAFVLMPCLKAKLGIGCDKCPRVKYVAV